MKKLLILAIFFCGAFALHGEETLSSKLVGEVPELKKVSEVSYKKLNGGFQLKGFDKSPGHKAILTEMKNFYKLLKKFNLSADSHDRFPQDDWQNASTSRSRVEELSAYVVLDEELKAVLSHWLVGTTQFSASGEVSQVLQNQQEAKKLEIVNGQSATIKGGHLIVEEGILDDRLDTKEGRLEVLAERFKLLEEQNKAITRSGFTIPAGGIRYPSGYYYNGNGTFSPVYNGSNSGSNSYNRGSFGVNYNRGNFSVGYRRGYGNGCR